MAFDDRADSNVGPVLIVYLAIGRRTFLRNVYRLSATRTVPVGMDTDTGIR